MKNGSAIVMARLVDRHEASIQRADLQAIEYSLYGVDPFPPNDHRPLAGQAAATLEVRDVVFDSLKTGGQWTLDELGYNFRHEIDLGEAMRFETGRHCEIRYQFTSASGQKTIARLRLSLERPEIQYPAAAIQARQI